MADESLKDYTINWVLGGFLLFCLLSFAITFMFNNNPTGLNDGTGDIFSASSNAYSGDLLESVEDSNSILNITANTNPEVSDLGSRDSVAVSFDSKRSTSSYFSNARMLITWVFSGTIGNTLIGVIGGLLGFLSLFLVWRFIRTGT